LYFLAFALPTELRSAFGDTTGFEPVTYRLIHLYAEHNLNSTGLPFAGLITSQVHKCCNNPRNQQASLFAGFEPANLNHAKGGFVLNHFVC
jgi:hypothetical protein